MRVLVTGGAGYIGSVVSTQLLAAGHDVVVLDVDWAQAGRLKVLSQGVLEDFEAAIACRWVPRRPQEDRLSDAEGDR